MLFMIKGIDEYMLPCMWKKTFNVDCMGCGMQRSIALILEGKFVAALYMYPAIYTLIAMFTFLLIHLKLFISVTNFSNSLIVSFLFGALGV